MVARAYTVAFEGVDARLVEVQCALAPGTPAITLVGLPDKAVQEARERIRAVMHGLSIALPSKRITINLAPADLPKEGSHFDLAIALSLLSALKILPEDEVEGTLALGELSLDGRLLPVPGALPAALTAAEEERSLICPKAISGEAAWVSATTVIGAETLHQVIRHMTGAAPLPPAETRQAPGQFPGPDLAVVKGQERARRALEVAAAGGHNLLMTGPPGTGKSLLAQCLPGILPPLSATEALETSVIHSIAGLLGEAGITLARPFRAPHHNASEPAMVGGGSKAAPGEISLAHNGVLFLDELPEFQPRVLESLRQPLETGEVSIARARAHLRWPARFMLIAAANPCRCGHLADAARACARAPRCGEDYLGRISGPLLDRFDLRIDVPPESFLDHDHAPAGEASAPVAARVLAARARQQKRLAGKTGARNNADLDPEMLEAWAAPDAESRALLGRVAERFGLSMRGYHRVLRVARSIADLAEDERVSRHHVAEAVSFRLSQPNSA